jgi:hypothetical protein
LIQSCKNLGIIDYEPVYNALEAVKMKRPECVEVVRGEGGIISPCNLGLPVNYFFDDIESGNINFIRFLDVLDAAFFGVVCEDLINWRFLNP